MNNTDTGVICICIFTLVIAVASLAIISFVAFEKPDIALKEPDTATGNKSHNFNDIVDVYGKTRAVSETAASWEECMDGAHERIVMYRDHSSIIAQMEWDIAVCDRLFPANDLAEPGLMVPGAIP